MYSIYPNSSCNIPIQVYCHNINTPYPREFITLAAGDEENYGYIYPLRLRRYPDSARNACDGPTGRLNYSAAGRTKFSKVRLDLENMRIVREDFTFSVTDPFGKQIPYGSAGDCFSMP